MKALLFGVRIIIVSSLLVALCINAAIADAIRKPAVSGLWYPADRQKLEQLIDRLTNQARNTDVAIPSDSRLKALILPHAGFIYSGLTAAHASRVLEPGGYKKIILLGPDHRVGFKNGAISDVNAYQTPLGLVRLHADAEKLRRQTELFHPSPTSDRYEHSLEAIIPFLQTYLNNFELVPIVLGPTDIQQMADIIDPLLDQDTLLVISSDLSHFLPYSEARSRDRQTLDLILSRQTARLINKENSACGKIPILVLLELARRHRWNSVLLHYSNSGDTAGDKKRVVGYAAIAFFEETTPTGSSVIDHHIFSHAEGQDLIKLARLTIMDRLGLHVDTTALDKDMVKPCYQKRCGTFVTITTKSDKLRGCIGNLTSKLTVAEGIKRNSIGAAFSDPRFPPLKASELDDIHISVSILTQPRLLDYSHSADLIAKLRVNEDGVIIRKANASATFLPQVWEQLPAPEKFLTHLCLKAGLPADAWRKSGLKVWTYQVQYFEEKN